MGKPAGVISEWWINTFTNSQKSKSRNSLRHIHATYRGPLHLERWPCRIVGIPGGEGRGRWELFPPKVKHGNDYMHCSWCWAVSLSLYEMSTQCCLSARWSFSNVNDWLTVQGCSVCVCVSPAAIHSYWTRWFSKVQTCWNICTGENLGQVSIPAWR